MSRSTQLKKLAIISMNFFLLLLLTQFATENSAAVSAQDLARTKQTSTSAVQVHDANSAKISDQDRAEVEKLAVSVGRVMIQQGHITSDIQKLIQTYVRNEYAQKANPNSPEASLSPAYDPDIQSVVADVLKTLNLPQPTPTPTPTPPTPTPTPPPTPTPTPYPQPSPYPQPLNPTPAPSPNPPAPPVVNPLVYIQPVVYPILPGQVQHHKNSGWIKIPAGQNPFWQSPVPLQAVPYRSQAPVIHIRQGWFGRPDPIRYSY